MSSDGKARPLFISYVRRLERSGETGNNVLWRSFRRLPSAGI